MNIAPAPARLFKGSKLVVASHNPGKVREISELLTPFSIEAISAGALDLPEPEETGQTFIENADLKALAAALASGLPGLADDSGLVVPALNGDPGIYSARWAGPDRDFSLAMAKIEHELKKRRAGDHAAHFSCALSLAWPDGHVEHFEGRVFGHLEFPPRGDKGFGYDPIFVPQGHHTTFAEMNSAAKHAMSHRADAFHQLIRACFKR